MPTTQRDRVLVAATAALRGEIEEILVRRAGRLALLNAGKELMWTGYSPQAELLKGVIVEVDQADRAVDLVAGALVKFYNATENSQNDAAFMAAVSQPGARLVVTDKADGTNIRPYVAPSGEVEFATRGMLRSDPAADGYLDFSGLARAIAADKYPALLEPALVRRYTVVCELIHPANRILTNYGEQRELLVITVIDTADGHELTRTEVVDFCAAHGLTPVAALDVAADIDLDTLVAEIKSRFAGTDLEGAVAAVEVPGAAVPFRLKIKGDTYLRLMRLARHCTMRRVRELAEAEALYTWDTFVAELHRLTPDLPEEVTMRYRELHDRWREWDAANRAAVAQIVAAYDALPEVANSDQKTFALSIAAHPQRSAFFALRKAGVERADEMLLPKVREQRADLLGHDVEPDELLAA